MSAQETRLEVPNIEKQCYEKQHQAVEIPTMLGSSVPCTQDVGIVQHQLYDKVLSCKTRENKCQTQRLV